MSSPATSSLTLFLELDRAGGFGDAFADSTTIWSHA